MELPSFVEGDRLKGLELLSQHAVREPVFFRGTYQIEVVEKERSFFPLLQVEQMGNVTDAFCTCEKEGGCAHLAAAYFTIFREGNIPLHVRNRLSFWNRLLQIAAKKYGCQPSLLEPATPGTYLISGDPSFSLKIDSEGEHRFKQILEVPQLEETSLQFAALSEEEVRNWREGKASASLCYELSFWAELAKWFLWQVEESHPYQVVFTEKKGKWPTSISLRFSTISLEMPLAKEELLLLLPSLSSVNSSLKVFQGEESIESIHFDPEKPALLIDRKKEPSISSDEGISFESWLYVYGKGFFRKTTESLFSNSEISASEIGNVLELFAKPLQNWLDVQVHLESIAPHYLLWFDEQACLHIQLYAFEPGDITFYFTPWVYISSSGFWRLENPLFFEKEHIIARSSVPEFLRQHRHWLHQFPGFQVHFGSLEAHLTYSFDEKKGLIFEAELNFPDQFDLALDFDEWVYLKGQGFYTKQPSQGRLPLHPGLHLPPLEISSFLVSHQIELEQVHRFFATRPAIVKMGLVISRDTQGGISIVPQYEYASGLSADSIRIYGDFAYVKDEGFSPLPQIGRLPERYRTPSSVPETQELAFLAYELDSLKPFALSIDNQLIKPSQLHLVIRKITRQKRTGHWLVDLRYRSEFGETDLFALWDAIHEKRSHLLTPAGLLLLKEARFHWLRQLPRKRLNRRRHLIRLSALEWIRLTTFEPLQSPQEPEIQQFLGEIERFETSQLLDFSLLQSTLRPYQERGVHWLWFLYCHQLSGLLCDDMGLGKTHQAMALLAAIIKRDPDHSQKYLVVCPTSVIYHWEALLKQFLPSVRVCIYYGIERTLDRFTTDFDLLLTSYGILRTGREDLQDLSFELAIFDEIQIAKNEASRTHRSLRTLNAAMRLGLTGTPVENRLQELKALFDLILPGYLPSDSVFRELFVRPIEKLQDPEKKKLLHRLIRPFILRRKKSEVLTDLPEKIEEIAYCDLSNEQRRLYEETALQIGRPIYQDLKDSSRQISYVHIFAALSALKQICDHPSLHLGDPHNFSSHSSGKWDLFVELLKEARNSGQKVVVFSQYLNMLAIIEAYLQQHSIGYAVLTGSTRDRKAPLRKFREDPKCEVFVASLLAAGVGIDLTVASIVIHYDRWWNPAKENQATDRVHRIGQSRGVQVFKLVTKHTIEEQIDSLIAKKKGLFESLIDQEDGEQISYLTRNELLGIFEKLVQNRPSP